MADTMVQPASPASISAAEALYQQEEADDVPEVRHNPVQQRPAKDLNFCSCVLECALHVWQWDLVDRLTEKGVSASDTKKLREAGLLTTKAVLRVPLKVRN